MKPKTEFDKFKEATAKILSVPKKEVERRAAEIRKDPKTGRYTETKKA